MEAWSPYQNPKREKNMSCCANKLERAVTFIMYKKKKKARCILRMLHACILVHGALGEEFLSIKLGLK